MMTIFYVAMTCPQCNQVSALPYTMKRLTLMRESWKPMAFHTACHGARVVLSWHERIKLIDAAIPPSARPQRKRRAA